MALTLQDKLALAMTSAGSQRALAALVGVSHQRIGRWLREGEPGGVARIPEWAADAINTAFAIHRDISRAQARADGLDFYPSAPTFKARKPLKTGLKGDRVFIESAQFIRPALRAEINVSAALTGNYFAGGARSRINLRRYVERIIDNEVADGKRHHYGRKFAVDALLGNLLKREDRVIDARRGRPMEWYTPYWSMSPSNAARMARHTEQALTEKHEPYVDLPGTVLADTLVHQLRPDIYAQLRQSETAARQQTRRDPRAAKRAKRKQTRPKPRS